MRRQDRVILLVVAVSGLLGLILGLGVAYLSGAFE